MKRSPVPQRKTPLKRTPFERGGIASESQAHPGATARISGGEAQGLANTNGRAPSLKRTKFSEASPAQRKKVAKQACILTGQDKFEATVDPAHLCPRHRGGCDSADCTIPLRRDLHTQFDDPNHHGPDLLPSLIAERRFTELAHMADHYDWDFVAILKRLTGDTYVPASDDWEAAATISGPSEADEKRYTDAFDALRAALHPTAPEENE